jgi:hypothetical protein
VPAGETRDIHRAGGRYVTLVGSNPLFHLPQDRWPHAVDTDVVTRVAAGRSRFAREANALTVGLPSVQRRVGSFTFAPRTSLTARTSCEEPPSAD